MKEKHQLRIRDASQDRQPEIHSSPSEGRFSKNCGADQQRLQISDPHFDKITTSATFACWKKRFKTEVCTCSQFPNEAMLWIKEVEMVDLKTSQSIGGHRFPNFEMRASALNKIITNPCFKIGGAATHSASLAPKRDVRTEYCASSVVDRSCAGQHAR